VFFRQLLNESSSCASYVVGCGSSGEFAVVDPHSDLVDEYVGLAEGQGARITAVLDTHVQADHVSGAAALMARCGATAHLPAGSAATFDHVALEDGESVRLGNVELVAISTPGHAPAHHAYVVIDHRRAPQPWLVLTGDALLVGDAGRPDLHAADGAGAEDLARTQFHSLTERLLALPDDLVLYPSHYGGSVCGRRLSATPVSTVGFERRHNPALRFADEDEFVAALLADVPPAPEGAAAIVAANLTGAAAVAGA
jgi:hydroxyacylglutathione hydrolase